MSPFGASVVKTTFGFLCFTDPKIHFESCWNLQLTRLTQGWTMATRHRLEFRPPRIDVCSVLWSLKLLQRQVWLQSSTRGSLVWNSDLKGVPRKLFNFQNNYISVNWQVSTIVNPCKSRNLKHQVLCNQTSNCLFFFPAVRCNWSKLVAFITHWAPLSTSTSRAWQWWHEGDWDFLSFELTRYSTWP